MTSGWRAARASGGTSISDRLCPGRAGLELAASEVGAVLDVGRAVDRPPRRRPAARRRPRGAASLLDRLSRARRRPSGSGSAARARPWSRRPTSRASRGARTGCGRRRAAPRAGAAAAAPRPWARLHGHGGGRDFGGRRAGEPLAPVKYISLGSVLAAVASCSARTVCVAIACAMRRGGGAFYAALTCRWWDTSCVSFVTTHKDELPAYEHKN